MTAPTPRNCLSGTATLATLTVVMAAFLATQDTPYPMLENLDFVGWLLLSLGIVVILAIPGLVIFGIYALAKWLLAIAFQRRPEPTPPTPPAPAAAASADFEDEWADIEREIREES